MWSLVPSDSNKSGKELNYIHASSFQKNGDFLEMNLRGIEG